jgi:hypothetical protein
MERIRTKALMFKCESPDEFAGAFSLLLLLYRIGGGNYANFVTRILKGLR